MKYKKLLGIIIVLAVLLLGGLLVYQNNQQLSAGKIEVLPEKSQNSEKTKADLNGDGKEETLSLSVSGSDENPVTSLVAYDENRIELARLPEGMPIKKPMANSAKVYFPVKQDKTQFVSYDFLVGPHSSETMFFGLFANQSGEKRILPICLTANVKDPGDCLFWSGQLGESFAYNFDKDGILEVVEIVDEYPKDGSITADIEKMIKEQFKEVGSEAANGMIRVTKREQRGRGNRVIWGIYRYNGRYFENQLGADYDKYYKLIETYLRNSNPNYPKIMRKSEMSKSSLEYNVFMRNFWVRR